MTFKKIIGKIHLWLGLSSGLIVLFLAVTGCILAFEREIEDATQSYRFAEAQDKLPLAPSVIKQIADRQLPGKAVHSIGYETGRSTIAVYFGSEPEAYYYLVFLDPYAGKVLKVKDMSVDFFRVVIMGHYYLWLPPAIGQPIVASATLIFFLLMITGLILWWPRHKAALKQRFSVKWNARWRRVNYDMHNVFGFYMTWVAVFIAVTGLIMGFQWFSKSVYWVASGGKQVVEYHEVFSDTAKIAAWKGAPAIDQLWLKTRQDNPRFGGSVEMHPPANDKGVIEVAINPDTETYWRADYRYYDQHTLEEITVNHLYGRYRNTSVADKIIRMNYDVHVGAIGGIPGKSLAFCASLVAASLPVTGFLIWRGRNKKKGRA
ncbi:PepSY-associated TM helix domain-containing protein [Hufsiella ginkgonis]|uniref:PepSY domain-containing protein n=1 Tax=Hufsiella ginkgonis TaxID=2695274 RepID=A0A7K1Y0T4_9SPHI|nr:PepSY-associated TM helix domain-containing protein [Hufsiella ginkgonis]MXV16812.1 PepSY domain-containing protein [Hufsiella ginkgonis]